MDQDCSEMWWAHKIKETACINTKMPRAMWRGKKASSEAIVHLCTNTYLHSQFKPHTQDRMLATDMDTSSKSWHSSAIMGNEHRSLSPLEVKGRTDRESWLRDCNQKTSVVSVMLCFSKRNLWSQVPTYREMQGRGTHALKQRMGKLPSKDMNDPEKGSGAAPQPFPGGEKPHRRKSISPWPVAGLSLACGFLLPGTRTHGVITAQTCQKNGLRTMPPGHRRHRHRFPRCCHGPWGRRTALSFSGIFSDPGKNVHDTKKHKNTKSTQTI